MNDKFEWHQRPERPDIRIKEVRSLDVTIQEIQIQRMGFSKVGPCFKGAVEVTPYTETYMGFRIKADVVFDNYYLAAGDGIMSQETIKFMVTNQRRLLGPEEALPVHTIESINPFVFPIEEFTTRGEEDELIWNVPDLNQDEIKEYFKNQLMALLFHGFPEG